MQILGSLASSFLNSGAEAAVLSGSRTSILKDQASDWDIYVYSSAPIDKRIRKDIYSALSLSSIVGMTFFEESDEAEDSHGNIYDIMFRSKEWTEWQVDDVWRKHKARIGYTTCFLHNIRTSEILYDRDGWLSSLQEELKAPYPEELRENIIRKNLDVVCGDGTSTFLIQADLAAKRDDIVSSNHRLAAILASYFDIIFAYNRRFHPGEKKLMGYAHLCQNLPENMDDDISAVIRTLGRKEHMDSLNTLISHLRSFADKM